MACRRLCSYYWVVVLLLSCFWMLYWWWLSMTEQTYFYVQILWARPMNAKTGDGGESKFDWWHSNFPWLHVSMLWRWHARASRSHREVSVPLNDDFLRWSISTIEDLPQTRSVGVIILWWSQLPGRNGQVCSVITSRDWTVRCVKSSAIATIASSTTRGSLCMTLLVLT